MISLEQLAKLYPRAPQVRLTSFLDQYATLFGQYGLSANANRFEFFLAQIGHESNGLSVTEENLNYSATRLVQVWPSRFPTPEAAAPYANNPQALANNVYANRMGNGNAQSNDGWNFRGRGYIQITGRETYGAVGQDAQLDLLSRPMMAEDPQYALQVVCAYWQWKNLNPLCDSGDFVTLTKRINGGTAGLDDRQAWLAKVRQLVPFSSLN